MNHTALVANEIHQDRPILIVDRKGEIGEALAKQLKEQALVVFVSKTQPEQLEQYRC